MSETESTALTGTQGAATQTEQSIAIIVEHRPEIVLLDDGKRDALFAHIEAEVAAFVPDMTTTKGRDECRSLAAKVTKTKTAVDKARLQLTEDARAKIKTINESGATIKEKLEALAETARAPLTAWETAEDARQALCKGALDRMRAAAVVPLGATSDGLKTRIAEIEAENMAEDQWLGMLELATETRATALAALKTALELIEQKERDAAELAELRAQAQAAEQERIAREARESEAAAAREREQREAEQAEQRRKDEEEAAARTEQEREAESERTRLAAEEAAAAAAERARAEEAARAEQQAAEQRAAHEAELAAAAARVAEAERIAQEERAAREAEDANRRAVEEAAVAERAALEANQARRRMVKTEAKTAMMACGASEDTAQKIVLAILAGEIPRVILDFSAPGKDGK